MWAPVLCCDAMITWCDLAERLQMTQVFAQTVLIVTRHTRRFPEGHLTVAMCSTVNTSEWVCLQ